MPGLFIQRHAEAAAKFCKVGLVYTHVVEDKKIKGVFEIESSHVNGVAVAKVYYNKPGTSFPGIAELVKAFRFYKANALGINEINRKWGGFDIVHVHILTRLGLIALYYKWFANKPFVITEHWSRYLDLTASFTGVLRKTITRLVVKNAAVVTTVTRNLANAMQKHGLKNNNYCMLANVVDESFYSLNISPKKYSEKKVITQVSCFEDKSKNISGLLRVIKSLSEKRSDFVFRLIGDGEDFEMLRHYSGELGLTESTVVFTGLLEGKMLVSEMASADLMVVFSNYENFPVVINESFVLGVPVIATAVGGIPEFVDNSKGRLITASDEKALEGLLNDFLDNKLSFSRQLIQSGSRDAFSTNTIGKELLRIYSEAVANT
jgi:glycosyltransferase involved in cell wall biosynthesis